MTTPNSFTEVQSNVSNPWVGLDIGGANLKTAHSSGWSKSCKFPMWKQSRSLGVSVAMLLDECPAFCGIAVTMTGELADCFATRAEGVAVILEQLTSVLPASLVRVYSLDGSWLTVSQAARDPWSVAASNWHGLARFATRFAGSDPCLLIDIGSTTTDIIPMHKGKIQLEARTDSQRLQSGALVYTGVERSNVAGIVRELTLYHLNCPVMNELFATSRDAYLWLGLGKGDPNDCDTADNQPATRHAARYRLARLVGEDGSTLTDSDLDLIATQIFQAQSALIAKAIEQVCFAGEESSAEKGSAIPKKKSAKAGSAPMNGYGQVLMSGHGDFLIEAALERLNWCGSLIRLRDRIGLELARCAPAYAIAVLASEELRECSPL